MSIRSEFAELLETDWAEIPELADVRVIATEATLDDIQQATALIRQKRIGKAPAAPNSHRTVGVLLTLISPHLDLDTAGDDLDTLVAAALDYLDPSYLHDDAEAVGYGERLAYDIPLSILASKE